MATMSIRAASTESERTTSPETPVSYPLAALGLPAARGQEDEVARVAGSTVSRQDFAYLSTAAHALGVTPRFRDVLATFPTPAGQTPAGFRIEATLQADGLLAVDLVRDIGRGACGVFRPTGTIFSADSANPYEVAPIAPLLGNLTCNPGIVYDLFLNNPEANVGRHFSTMPEVMTELGRILGPGCDISVEIENPFEPDINRIIEEMEQYRELLTPYRLVVKVPHTGSVNADNANELFTGDGRLHVRAWEPSAQDAFRGHRLALELANRGYRVNFTLMFEPYQTTLALQAKPAFINSFVRHRQAQGRRITGLLAWYRATREDAALVALRDYLVASDHLSAADANLDLLDVLRYATDLCAYRRLDEPEGADGLDGVRHNLRLLRQSNLADTRLIVCSMEGPDNYPALDRLIADPEFADIVDRLVITAEPSYLARFASANQVVSYQRRFLKAVATN